MLTRLLACFCLLASAASATYLPSISGNVTVASGTVTANLGTLNGAATAAKQPALGTAGTPSVDVLSVQLPTQPTNTGSLSATGTVVSADLRNSGGAILTIYGTFVGQVAFQSGGADSGFANTNSLTCILRSTINSTMITGTAGTCEVFVPGGTYFRAQCTSYTSGTIQATITPVQAMATPFVGTIPSVAVLSTLSTGNVQAIPAVRSADLVWGTITTTTTSGAVTPGSGVSFAVEYSVTAASGTGQTLDVVVQQSDSVTGAWYDMYHFPRITANGTYRSPPLPLNFNRIRYIETVGGTNPSFSRNIVRSQLMMSALPIYQFFDRTSGILSGTNAATTAAYQVNGCQNFTARVCIGAASTPGTYQLQVSSDGANWTKVGAATAAVANSTVLFSVTGIPSSFVQVVCTSGATSQTGTYISINAQ